MRTPLEIPSLPWRLRGCDAVVAVSDRLVTLTSLTTRLGHWAERVDLIHRAEGWSLPTAVVLPMLAGGRDAATELRALLHDCTVREADVTESLAHWVGGVVQYVEGAGRIAQRPVTPRVSPLAQPIAQRAGRVRALLRQAREAALPVRVDVADVITDGVEVIGALLRALSDLEMRANLADRLVAQEVATLAWSVRCETLVAPPAETLARWLEAVVLPAPAVSTPAMPALAVPDLRMLQVGQRTPAGAVDVVPDLFAWPTLPGGRHRATDDHELGVDGEVELHGGDAGEEDAWARRVFGAPPEVRVLGAQVLEPPLERRAVAR